MNEKLIALYAHALAFVKADRDEERGATAVEYGLLVALIAAALVTIVVALQGSIENAFQSVIDAMPGGGDAA